MHFIWPHIFWLHKHLVFSFTNMCSMCKRLHSSGKLILHKRLFFENGALKMLFRHVWYFHFSNFNMDFVRQIFKLNPKFCCETKCCILATIDSNMVLPWILTEIEKKFACLVFLNWRHMRYSVFVLSRICANSYFIITNQSYIHWLFTKNGEMKVLLSFSRY